jgi:alpha-acetolactate decarboxylase
MLCDKANEGLYQVSTLQALMQGNYDGQTRVSELRKRSDIGIGTFENVKFRSIPKQTKPYVSLALGRKLGINFY